MAPPKGLLILGGGKDVEDEDEESGDSEEALGAAKDLAAAVKAGDAESIVAAFKTLKMACED